MNNNYQNQFSGQNNNNQMPNYSNQNMKQQNNFQSNNNQPYQNQNQKSGAFMINNNNFYQNNQNYQSSQNNQNFQGNQNYQNFQGNQNYQNFQRNQNNQNFQRNQNNLNFQGNQNNQNFKGNQYNQYQRNQNNQFQGNQNNQFQGNQNNQGSQKNVKYQNTHNEEDDPKGYSSSMGIYDINPMNQNMIPNMNPNMYYNNNFNNNFNNNNYNNMNQYQNQNSFNHMNYSNQNIMQNNMSSSGQNFQNNMLNSPQFNNQNMQQQNSMNNSNGNLQINNMNQYNQNGNMPQSYPKTTRRYNPNPNQNINQNFVPPISQRSQQIYRPQQFNNYMENLPLGRQISQQNPNYQNLNIISQGNSNMDLTKNPLNLIINSGNYGHDINNNPQNNNIQNYNNNQNQNNQGQQQNQMDNNINNNNMQFINQGQNNKINKNQPQNNFTQNMNQNEPQQNINKNIPQQKDNQNNKQVILNPYCKNNNNKGPIGDINEEGKNEVNPPSNEVNPFVQDSRIMNLEKDNFISLAESIPLESINKLNFSENQEKKEKDKKEEDKKEETNDNKQKNIGQNEEKKYVYQGETPRFLDDKNDNNQTNSTGLPQLNDYLKSVPNNNNENKNFSNTFGKEEDNEFKLLKSYKKKPVKDEINNNIQNNNNINEKEKMLTNKGDEDESQKKYEKIGADEYLKNMKMANKDDDCAPNLYTNKGDEDLSQKYKKQENEIDNNKNQEEKKEEKKNQDEKRGDESLEEEELGVREIDDDEDIMISRQENDSLFPVESVVQSVQISEELAKDIHKHSLSNEPLSNEICTLCLDQKTCEKGYKCKNCNLNICDECSTKIRINEFDKRKHEHQLTLLNEENCKCNKCNKELKSNKNFYFTCKKCNFYICLNCYNPGRKEEKEEDESIHEHPLDNVSEFRDTVCKLCEEETNSGVVCATCDIIMCQKCAAKVYKRKFKRELHDHPLYLTLEDDWKCNECGSKYSDKIAFHCKKCSVYICGDCYME